MSMAPSNRTRARIDVLIFFVAALGACSLAQAKQSDKNQPININANAFSGSQDSGKIVFTGNVTLDQGTFHADGGQATGYTDPNDTSQWQRVALTGSPAHFQQTQDSGMLVHGQASTIDYKVSEDTVILTGNAEVVQQGRGEFHGNRLVYNTDTGEIAGTPTTGGRVHITLQPRTKSAPAKPSAAQPASGSTAAAQSSSMVGTAAPPANAASTAAPATASSSGTH
jgi:lipopolysaccharide export system protein LptA